MKALLYEIANALAFLFLIATIFFFYIAFEDGDIIALKTSLAGFLP